MKYRKGYSWGLGLAAVSVLGFFGHDDGYLSTAWIRLRALGPVHGSASAPSIAATPEAQATALEFLGTGFTRGRGPGTPSNTYFAFADVSADCLPNYPVTIIWRAKPEPKTGYYSTFFWGNDGPFEWKNGTPDSYWGAHPYPDTGGGDFDVHHWEIATDFGGDIVETIAGTRMALQTDRWYAQGFRAWRTVTGRKVHRFYIDLTSLKPDSIIEARVEPSFGNATPPNPSLVWGGAPWGRIYGNDETYRGLIRGIQIYNEALSEADMLQEASEPLSTPAGRESIWYLKMDPAVGDMSSDVPSAGQGDCRGKLRRPTLRIDREDVKLRDEEDQAAVKVRTSVIR